MWRVIFSTSLQHTLYFIFIFIIFLSPHFLPPSSIHRDRCKPPPQAATGQSPTPQTPQDRQPTTPNRHRQVTHATNTSRSVTPKPHPRLNHTHGSTITLRLAQTTTPRPRSVSKPKPTPSKPTSRSVSRPSTQAHAEQT